MAKLSFAFAWFALLCTAGPSAAGELTSASFRLRGANLNGGSQAALQSTAPAPRFAGSGVALGQSEALGFSGSGASLTSAAPGFWPIAAGQVRTGRRDLSDDDWTDRSDNTCDLTRHLYCFEQ